MKSQPWAMSEASSASTCPTFPSWPPSSNCTLLRRELNPWVPTAGSPSTSLGLFLRCLLPAADKSPELHIHRCPMLSPNSSACQPKPGQETLQPSWKRAHSMFPFPGEYLNLSLGYPSLFLWGAGSKFLLGNSFQRAASFGRHFVSALSVVNDVCKTYIHHKRQATSHGVTSFLWDLSGLSLPQWPLTEGNVIPTEFLSSTFYP